MLDDPVAMNLSKDTVASDVRWPVHIEVRVSASCNARFDIIRELVYQHMSSEAHLVLPSEIRGWQGVKTLADNVERIYVSESPCPSSVLPIASVEPVIHVYQLSEDGPSEEMTGGNGGPGDDVMAASVYELPSSVWEGLWDSLIYSENIKFKLLDYIYATIIFSDADVDFNVVSWNRVVLLHGPPGTGKTSLCRALAQKLAIRLSSRYSHARLLEINSHSLFSRWFSESGKLVQKLFSSVNDLCEEEDCFVTVLIDEVESLTAARAGAMAGTEPSDALRVVNALLTQLDKLKHRKNVLVLSTSNLAKAIDSAFIDRADIVQYIDLPPRNAIYEILRTSLVELIKKGIITHIDVPNITQAYAESQLPEEDDVVQDDRQRSRRAGVKLLHLAEKCEGMSGRTLRRLPVIAHASYIGLPVPVPSTPQSGSSAAVVGCLLPGGKLKRSKTRHGEGVGKTIGPQADVMVWLEALERVVASQAADRSRVSGHGLVGF